MIGVRCSLLSDRLAEAGEPPLDGVELDLAARILDGVELGASRHATTAQRLLIHAAALSRARPAIIARFVKETRGAEAPIVARAVDWLLGESEVPPADLEERARRWTDLIASQRADLVRAAAEHLRDAGKLILFDYSGTVADIVRALAAAGRRPALVVPESRAIDGGRRYLEDLAALALPMRFVFDAALDQELPGAHALLLGAERLTADGGLVNTLGSRGAARMARAHGVPVLGCAELIKIDHAGAELPPPRDFREDMFGRSEGFDGVDCSQFELELVPAELITFHLTDRGVLPPRAFPSNALAAP